MSSWVMDVSQFAQGIDEPQKEAQKPGIQHEQPWLSQYEQKQDVQHIKLTYQTRLSHVMSQSWSQNSKSILQSICTPSKSSTLIGCNDQLGFSPVIPKHLKKFKKFNKFKKLDEQDKFLCVNCTSDTSSNCEICKGKKRLNGGDRLIKFFEYILQFKLGQKQSYESNYDKKLYPKKNIMNQHPSICYSTINPILVHDQIIENQFSFSLSSEHQKVFSMVQHQQKVRNHKDVHYNYSCDECQMNPIQGQRHHCLKCQDFDLCEQCFHRHGHFHQMSIIQLKNNHKALQKIGTLLRIQNSNRLGSSIRNSQSMINSSISSKGFKSWIR